MKICAYVQEQYAKQTYKNECLDTRKFVGLRVVVDCLERAGYSVDWAGIATVHQYDVVLVSLTSDCDWWSYIAERQRWKPGNYKILVGGAGVLHVTPFLPWFDAVMFGRGENLIVNVVEGIETGNRWINESVAYSDTFDESKDIYRVAQVDQGYCHEVDLQDGNKFNETTIGCNHRCLFCGYTWQRKFVSPYGVYKMKSSLFGDIADKERAMLDLVNEKDTINWSKLRTTAIDGFSERLRNGVNKKITRRMMYDFVKTMIESDAKPHQLKFYNICGYPTETEEDWQEYIDTIRQADNDAVKSVKQWSIVLHSTPFRPMPCTPMACAPASKKNYRGLIGSTLGKDLKGGLIYQGKSLWSVESMGTDSLSSVMLSMIAHRGGREDSENISKLCASKKFWSASAATKEATLTRYFDMDKLFGAYTAETLPSRYLRTYCQIEKMWGKTPLEIEHRRRENADEHNTF